MWCMEISYILLNLIAELMAFIVIFKACKSGSVLIFEPKIEQALEVQEYYC